MKKTRIIVRLDIKGPNVVKGIQFECLRVMGKPGKLAEEYYLQGADELLYLDTVANLYRRDNLKNIVHRASERIFIPLTAGGGIRKLEDIQDLLQVGADKVAINTAATKNPELIKKAAQKFGSQCIVVSIEAKNKGDKKWEAYVDNGRQNTGLDAVKWAKKAESLGAGEIIVTSVDQEGTENGLDLELIKAVSESVAIPVIASGGCGSLNDFSKCALLTEADAIATASLLHYRKYCINEIKEHMAQHGIPVRRVPEAKKVNTDPFQGYDLVNYNKYTLSQLEDEYLDVGLRKAEPKDDLTYGSDAEWKIGVIDYEINNVKSVLKSLEIIGKKAKRITTSEDILAAKYLILPGVGAFKPGMDALQKKGFIEPIKKKVNDGTPLLGICLGLQLLFTESEEFGLHKGFDLIHGRIVSLKLPEEVKMPGYRIPHMGWNELKPANGWQNSLLKSVPPNGNDVYFAHSYYPVVTDPEHIIATTVYGNQEFAVAVKKDNVSTTQFHPEKSGIIGLKILKSFCEEV